MAYQASGLSVEDLQNDFCQRGVPYLFRSYTSKSHTNNTEKAIIPAGCLTDDLPNLQSLSQLEGRDMLQRHLTWDTSIDSQFSSWSCSLLFCLKHLVREVHQKTPTVGHICIMDTSSMLGVPFQVPISAKLLSERWNCPYRDRLYNHEYLVHGKIVNDGRYEVVKFESLVDSGLFNFLPELNDNRNQLACWLNSWRNDTFFHETQNSIHADIKQARELGECFGSHLALPATLAFLCLRKRPDISDKEFWQQLRDCLHDIEVPLVNHELLSRPITTDERLPEVAQFVRLMKQVKMEERRGAWNERVDMNDIAKLLDSMQFESDLSEDDGDQSLLDELTEQFGENVYLPPELASSFSESASEEFCSEGHCSPSDTDTDNEAEELNIFYDLLKVLEDFHH